MKKIVLLTFINIIYFNAVGQNPKKSDFYYERVDTIANGQNKYVKVILITNGQHTFYSKDKHIITKGTFKNGRLINGEQYYYNDRVVFYQDGKYKGYLHVEEISNELSDTSKQR